MRKRRVKNGTDGKRRANGSGTLERRGDKWRARYYFPDDGKLKRKVDTITAELVTKAINAWHAANPGRVPPSYLPDPGAVAEPFSRDVAQFVLAFLSNGNGKIIKERKLEKDIAELQGVKDEIEAERKAQAEKAAREAERAALERATPIKGAFDLYKASKRRPDSGARTLDGYRAQYEIFAEWMGKNFPDAPKLRDVTHEMAEAFIDHMEKSRSRNTRNKYVVFLRTFWRVMRWHHDAQLQFDPWEGIGNLVQMDEVSRKELTVDQLRRTFAALALPPERCTAVAKAICGELPGLFIIGVYTGMRLGDCACLRWEDVDLVRGFINVELQKTARKYKRRVFIPIHPAFMRMLTNVPEETRTGYVLPGIADTYLNREPSMITKRVQDAFKAAGIETGVEVENQRNRIKVGFHSLRHTFASIMLNSGVPFALVEKMLGHSNDSMTAHYFHENRAALADAVAKLPIITFADEAEATATALPALPCGETIDVQGGSADAPQDGLSAFRATVDGMDADDLQQAFDYLKAKIEKGGAA